MNALGLNSDTDTRRGLDRWENEGGRIRLGPSREAGYWHRDRARDAGEAGSRSWWMRLPISWSGPRKKEES